MINIDVYSHSYVEIENKNYQINNRKDMLTFLKDLLDKCFYSDETICLESVTINLEQGENNYTEIERWK